jgi:hypothetical protein
MGENAAEKFLRERANLDLSLLDCCAEVIGQASTPSPWDDLPVIHAAPFTQVQPPNIVLGEN